MMSGTERVILLFYALSHLHKRNFIVYCNSMGLSLYNKNKLYEEFIHILLTIRRNNHG